MLEYSVWEAQHIDVHKQKMEVETEKWKLVEPKHFVLNTWVGETEFRECGSVRSYGILQANKSKIWRGKKGEIIFVVLFLNSQ